MPYTRQMWFDGPGGGTPVDAERLNHLEAGLEDAAAAVDDRDAAGAAAAVQAASLQKANNLADLTDPVVAKANLGLDAESGLLGSARYRLAGDFTPPTDVQTLIPFAVEETDIAPVMGTGATDLSLGVDNKVLINTAGYYRCFISGDWEATASPYHTDHALRQMGMRLQRSGEADGAAHRRLGFVNTPGSLSPRKAFYPHPDDPNFATIGIYDPASIAAGATVYTDVTLEPAGIINPGDYAQAAHAKILDSTIGAAAVAGLIVHAKVIAADTVRVSFTNTTGSAIDIPSGKLRVMGIHSGQFWGISADAWAVTTSAAVPMGVGDKVYGQCQHKVDGTLLQDTASTYLHIERVR